MLTADGVPPVLQSHAASNVLQGLPDVAPSQPYTFVVASFLGCTITRRSINLAVTSACLIFTALQSASLCLVTTPAEAMASALAWFLQPLRLLGINTKEVHLTLLLSLRFMGIMFEEVRNLVLGVAARGIDWKKAGFMGSADVVLTLCGRLFGNLFAHADNISQSMVMRGFTTPEAHAFHMQQLRPSNPVYNAVALLGLAGLVATIAINS
jgi:energy-coupling factor transporter transmembrane protein EcfT